MSLPIMGLALLVSLLTGLASGFSPPGAPPGWIRWKLCAMNRLKAFAVFRAELMESFFMAANSLAAHKLRSALTLLGVLVGVFSIIVVMTTMRAMQKFIESNLSQLGGETFVVDKWPGFSVQDNAKYRRRKDESL